MIKHAIIDANVGLGDLLRSDISAGTYTGSNFLEHVRRSVMVKQDIVSKDFKETGLRRILNLGHTVGHAFESHALRHGIPIAHGYAVAWGLVTEPPHIAHDSGVADRHHISIGKIHIRELWGI